MTAHAHDPHSSAGDSHAPPPTGRARATPARPRWLLPGLAAAIVVGLLVLAGVLSLSAVLYAGLFGGMLLMHLGGHGGHGGHGGGTSSDDPRRRNPVGRR